MKPKRILYLENCIGYGGAAICLKLLAANLNRDKYYPIVVTTQNDKNYQSMKEIAEWIYMRDRFIDRDSLKSNIESFFVKFKVKGRLVEVINSFADYAINLFPYLLRLLILVKRKRVNLIHLNNDALSNMGGVIISRLLKIPCVGHVRNPVMWDSRTIRRLYGNMNYIITVAEWVKRKVIKLGIDESKVQTIYDGRILDEFLKPFDVESTRRSIGLIEKQLSVGMIGLLIPWKGHRVFIDAAQIVEKQYPGCKMFIVGMAPKNCREYEMELKKSVKDKDIKNLVFTGHIENIPNVMRILDVIVHASIAPDPYPNVVIEAMAAGKPMIATNIGGPPEMIDNNKTGILVPPKKPYILAEKICELLENPELRILIGESAQKVAFERNSIEAHVIGVEAVYEKVLGESMLEMT